MIALLLLTLLGGPTVIPTIENVGGAKVSYNHGIVCIEEKVFQGNCQIISEKIFRNCRIISTFAGPDDITTVGFKSGQDTVFITFHKIGHKCQKIKAFEYDKRD